MVEKIAGFELEKGVSLFQVVWKLKVFHGAEGGYAIPVSWNVVGIGFLGFKGRVMLNEMWR